MGSDLGFSCEEEEEEEDARWEMPFRKLTWSASQRRERKIQEKKVRPDPMMGIFWRDDFKITKKCP